MYRVSSGVIRFKLKTIGQKPIIKLFEDYDGNFPIYKIALGRDTKVKNYTDGTEMNFFTTMQFDDFSSYKDICLTWYSRDIQLFLIGQDEPLLTLYKPEKHQQIMYIQFKPVCQRWIPVKWIVETSPVDLEAAPKKIFKEPLTWVPMTNDQLPQDAIIGGYENEFTYIARAYHNGSLCPGKYVPSKKTAYIPWGHQEHPKKTFDILCGFNATWVKTRKNKIPPNAFVAGHSEAWSHPLYIGRAMLDGSLISGKVHVYYKHCYLPYHGAEIETSKYEILVIPDDAIPQAIPGQYNSINQKIKQRSNAQILLVWLP